MDIVDKITTNDLPLSLKIVRLWAVTQLNYRAALGDKAWDKMRALTNSEITSALAFLTGFCSTGDVKEKQLKKLLPELQN